jgi:hypothetical protein
MSMKICGCGTRSNMGLRGKLQNAAQTRALSHRTDSRVNVFL